MRCRRGAYLIEFTAIAAGLLTMLFGAVEMAWQGVTAVAMENALLEASRIGSLGCLQPDGSRAGQVGVATLKAAAKSGGSGFLDNSTLDLTPQSYGSFQQMMSDTSRSLGAAGAGGSGQIVVYRLTYDAPLLFAGALLNKDHYTHSGTITIRNEPFTAGGASVAIC